MTNGRGRTDAGAVDRLLPRRDFLKRAGAGGFALASSGLLAACGSVKEGAASGGTVLRVGYVSPRTGPAAAFGETDDFILGLVKKATAGGISAGGKKYDVEFILKDSQSDPQRAAAVANDLISGDRVDLMLASSTPQSVSPVSDACEAAGVPCISTVVPWQAWYFGRGAKPEDKAAYRFTYHFYAGIEDFHAGYIALWDTLDTNKKIAALWPNDSDGEAFRTALAPMFEKSGYTVVDPGAYENGTNDYSAQIAMFKREKCDLLSTVPLPPDFATFWKQAAQQGFKPKVPTLAKTGLFPSQVEALGRLGEGVATSVYWHADYPYKSSLTGASSREIADGYEKATGKQWTQVLGSGVALFDAAIAALKAAPDPKDRNGLADTISKLRVDTPVGELDWNKGPVKNAVGGAFVGAQWNPTPAGSKFPLKLDIVESAGDSGIPSSAKFKYYA